MSKQYVAVQNESRSDEDIRRLVLERLKILSVDEAISVGALGSFTRDQMIEHVERSDEIGKTLEAIEVNWIRSLKEGGALYANGGNEA